MAEAHAVAFQATTMISDLEKSFDFNTVFAKMDKEAKARYLDKKIGLLLEKVHNRGVFGSVKLQGLKQYHFTRDPMEFFKDIHLDPGSDIAKKLLLLHFKRRLLVGDKPYHRSSIMQCAFGEDDFITIPEGMMFEAKAPENAYFKYLFETRPPKSIVLDDFIQGQDDKTKEK